MTMSNTNEITDVIIVGAGTAGLSAAIYAARAGKSVIVFEGKMYGGQIVNTPEVENYPGIKNISGFDFATSLYEQAKSHGVKVVMQNVTAIENDGAIKKVVTPKDTYAAKSVILATGAVSRKLGLPHENEWVGAGVSYCATCDGNFYRGKTVAVNGGGNTALEDAIYLSGICEKVYVIHRRDEFRGEGHFVETLKNKDNVEFILDSTISELRGDGRLESLIIKNKKTEEETELPVNGLFVAIGQIPLNSAFADVVELDDAGYIVAGEDTKTSADGIFAAGDGRTKKVRQLVTAAGDGAIAAIAACAYADEI